MSSASFPNGTFPTIAIHAGEPLPNTCITCGMFTDHLVKSKFLMMTQKSVAAGESGSKVALGCLLHLLGTVWFIIGAIF